jgi:surfeit locus 1 family protein
VQETPCRKRGYNSPVTRRSLSFLLLAAVAAAICARLGFWQLSRLAERRARNAAVVERLRDAPVPVETLSGDTAAIRYRRVRVAGRPDYAREVVLVNRSRDGSPGVNLITPVRVAGRDTAVLVNRGWVYSPNGTDVELPRWRDADSLDVEGWVEVPSRRTGVARLSSTRGAYRWLDPAELAREVGYPVSPFYVVVAPAPGETPSPDRPARLTPPALDEGPHKSYAVQWFSFAAVALVGAGAFARSERRRARE